VARIGIDLGTWNSAAAFCPEEGSDHNDVAGRDGETIYGKTFPSFVFFDTNGEVRVIGEHAKEQVALNPGLVVWGVKRFVGMPYDEAFKVEEGFRLFGYRDRVERTDSGGIAIRFGSKVYTPTDVLAIILRRIKEDAENVELNPMLNGKVDGATITVPAYFDPTRVTPVLRAAELAGFGKVGEQIAETAEPTAAMLAYVNANRDTLPKGGKGLHVLTFDIGAGTTDLTLNRFDLMDGDIVVTEVSIEGDNHVGGINMDSALLDFLKHKYASTGLADDETAQAKLLPKIEQAKIELTEYREMDKASLLTVVRGKPARFELSRDELVATLTPVWDRAVLPLHELFRESKRRANVGPDRVDIVLFVGGPSKMPWLRQRVRRELAEIGVPPVILAQVDRIDTAGFPPGCDPMKAVAHGAALQRIYVTKLNPYGFGTSFGEDYYACILKDNQPHPIREEKLPLIYYTTGKRTTVDLIRKTCVADPVSKQSKAVYVRLGEFDFYVPGGPDIRTVEVSLLVTKDRELEARIKHEPSGQSVVYKSASRFTGEQVYMQETNPPKPPKPEDIADLRRRVATDGRDWTPAQLTRVVHAAGEVAKLPGSQFVSAELTALRDAAAKASFPDAVPQTACPDVLNRANVLLDALHGAGAISQKEFEFHRDQLREIEQGV
jgi:molecular chaperone DnaK (HSP70)